MFIISLKSGASINVFQFIDSTSAGYSVSPTVTRRSLISGLAFSWGLEKQATYNIKLCFRSGGAPDSLLLLGRVLAGSEGASGAGTEVQLVCGRVPSECSFSPGACPETTSTEARRRKSTGRDGMMTCACALEVMALQQAGPSMGARVAGGHSAGSEHGGCGGAEKRC